MNITCKEGKKNPTFSIVCHERDPSRADQHTYTHSLLTLTLTFVVICRPPIKDIVLALAGLFELLFYLSLHFVLLIYSFLIHIIGFSKQICFQSFLKLVKVFTIFNFHW